MTLLPTAHRPVVAGEPAGTQNVLRWSETATALAENENASKSEIRESLAGVDLTGELENDPLMRFTNAEGREDSRKIDTKGECCTMMNRDWSVRDQLLETGGIILL